MTTTPEMAPSRIEPVDLQQEMRRSYLDYAMSVIVARALPDARDGLKPVHRRILFSMYDQGHTPDKKYVKSARVVGHGKTRREPFDQARSWRDRYELIGHFFTGRIRMQSPRPEVILDDETRDAFRYRP